MIAKPLSDASTSKKTQAIAASQHRSLTYTSSHIAIRFAEQWRDRQGRKTKELVETLS